VTGSLGRVLVVDDNDNIRRLIAINLELEGFEVVTARDGIEALELVRDAAPDVITIDWKMPRLDGPQTVARLRADPRTRDLPIAMVTANAQEVDRAYGESFGVDAYLTKPFDPQALVAMVRRLAGHPDP
jgi:CheY-like chemotaxis protein